jgi:hypothetical protein
MKLTGGKFTRAAWFSAAIGGFELRTRGSRVWIYTRIPADCEETRTGVDRFDLKMFVSGVNSGTK